jgi:hypothetical protein
VSSFQKQKQRKTSAYILTGNPPACVSIPRLLCQDILKKELFVLSLLSLLFVLHKRTNCHFRAWLCLHDCWRTEINTCKHCLPKHPTGPPLNFKLVQSSMRNKSPPTRSKTRERLHENELLHCFYHIAIITFWIKPCIYLSQYNGRTRSKTCTTN